ncbi:MAG: glycosyltransferase family 9 protein [Pirellulales bacterium]|nr:glycosyltransferase family 9 protein [Pirellulales bacterium]
MTDHPQPHLSEIPSRTGSTARNSPPVEQAVGVQRLRRMPLGRYRYVRARWRILFAVVDFLGEAVFGAGRSVRRLVASRARPPAREYPPEQPKVILLVQLDHLGDAILSTAVLPVLRDRYPAASIEVLAGAWNREVFEAMPQVDRVHVSRINRFARGSLTRFAWIPAMLWWGLRLRRRRVDLGLDVRGEFPVAVILWLCGARRRIGWDCGGGGFLLTDRVDFVPGRPEVESRWAVVSALGIDLPETPAARKPRFCPSESARRRIGRRLAELPSPGSAPCVVLHVGAGTQAKSWPVEHWRELLGRIIVGHGAQIILVGSGKDRPTAWQILGSRPWPGVTDWTGALTQNELAALLRRADVLVGADSGPAHLAAAVGTAVVVLFSGTNHARQWRPAGERVTVLRHAVACSPCHRERCPRAEHPCMSGLLPGRVAAELEGVLAEPPAGRRGRRIAARREGAPS